MQVDETTLRKNFESLSTEELLVRRSAGTLTPQAEIILAEVLAQRQATIPGELQDDAKSGPDHRTSLLLLREHFLGKRPLWSAFWLIGALGFVKAQPRSDRRSQFCVSANDSNRPILL